MIHQEEPLISIIILNYNQLEITCQFLESTKKLKYRNYEIILIDNASKINPEPVITKKYPEVRLIVNQDNLGSTGGNNQAARLAKGEYLFIVNNDTEVTEDILNILLEAFNRSPDIGMVCPKIYFFDQPKMIQYAGYTKINPYTGRNKAIGGKEIDNGQHDTPSYTEYAHGAAVLVKKEVIDAIGLYPEHFFIYYEELDWSARAIKEGYKIYYEPKAKIYHKESVTMGKESPIKAYYHTRNRILFMKRNHKWNQFFIFSLFLFVAVIPKGIIKYISKGQFLHLKRFIRATFDGLISK